MPLVSAHDAMGGSGPAKRRQSLTTLWWARHPKLRTCCQKCPSEEEFGGLQDVPPGAWPLSLTPLALPADEPTSPSIDLQAKHVPASAVVSSAMNSAPVLGTSPSSPTFTFALSRHYSQDCSECLWPVSPLPPLSGPCGSFAQCLFASSGAPWESPLLTRREGS